MDRVIRAFLETLRKTQIMPPEQMREYQRSLLVPLLRHAREHVSFYRDTRRLAPLFRADDSIDWDRWQEIPPLTRKDLQQQFERLTADGVPSNHGQILLTSTSGSTGEPVKILQTELSQRWTNTALRLRDFEWHRIDPTKRLAFLYPFTPEAFDITGVRRHSAWRPAFEYLNLAGERIDIADTRPAMQLVEAVVAVRPDYLQVQPTALQLMIACDQERTLPGLGLSGIITFGEYLSSDSKRDIEQYLGCKIMDYYASEECNYLAVTCARCGNYHVHAETALVEAVDDEGNHVAAGEMGRLLVTSFYNYAMPLIRYDHEDLVRPASADCEIRLPALHEIFGKKREPFMFPGNGMMRPTFPPDAAMNFLGARVFQVAQTGPDRCEFRIVPGSLSPAEMQFDEMTTLLRAMWWDGLQIDYRIVESIPRRTPRAKFQPFPQEFYDPSELSRN